MIAEWSGPDGTRWLWSAPPALAVVDLLGQILPRQGADGWRALAAWCAARCIGIEGAVYDGEPLDWDRLSAGQRVRLVEQLDASALDAWASHILTTISLDAQTLKGVRELARVAASGGCECRRCKARDERGPASACLYHAIPAEAERRVQIWWQLRESPLESAPWWCWQMREAWELGRAEAQAEAKRKADQRSQVDDLLKRKGKLR